MPRQQGLLLRGNRWHSNFKVPRDLQAALGKTHNSEDFRRVFAQAEIDARSVRE